MSFDGHNYAYLSVEPIAPDDFYKFEHTYLNWAALVDARAWANDMNISIICGQLWKKDSQGYPTPIYAIQIDDPADLAAFMMRWC